MQNKIEKRPLNKNETVMFEAVKSKDDTMAESIIGLLSKDLDDEKADLNSQDEYGKTLLHYASERHLENTSSRLLSAGVSVNTQDNQGFTPLVLVFNAFHLLIKPLPDDPLSQFPYRYSYEMIKNLVNHGADINAQNQYKQTCLDVVIAKNNYYAPFDFLGFTFYLGKSRSGVTLPKLKTNGKRYRSKLNKVKDWARQIRNKKTLRTIWKTFCSKLRGHVQYYGVSFNLKGVRNFSESRRK